MYVGIFLELFLSEGILNFLDIGEVISVTGGLFFFPTPSPVEIGLGPMVVSSVHKNIILFW